MTPTPTPRISRRLAALSPSATLAVVASARRLRAEGADVVSFAAGEPDFDTPQPIKDAAIAALNAGKTKYGPVPGDEASRAAIAAKLTTQNGIAGLTPDHVVLTAGGKHALYEIFQALIDEPGPDAPASDRDLAILPTPAWVSFRAQMELAGAEVLELATDASSDFKLTPERLRDAITERTSVVLINSPSNPCGTMYTPTEMRALADVLADAAETVAPRLMVVSDEIYDTLVYPEMDPAAEHLSLGALPRIAERVVTVNGLSKTYAMTGWRLGYLACPGEFGKDLCGAIRRLQSQSITSVPTFLMDAVPEALGRQSAEAERMRSAFAARARLMHGLLQEIDGFVTPRPTGAMYCFPDVSACFGATSAGGARIDSAMDFATALLEEQHVAVVPGEDFGAGGEKGVRLTFASSDDDIRRGVERIAQFVGGLTR